METPKTTTKRQSEDDICSSTLTRAQAGDPSALNRLAKELGSNIRRWARGRLPQWARRGIDTADLVHDVLLRTLSRLNGFELKHKNALRAYLRQAVQNRVVDEIRRARRYAEVPLDDAAPLQSPELSPFGQLLESEKHILYRRALQTLRPRDQKLIVARFELGYSFDQIALITGRRRSHAARVAVRRAVLRLAEAMNLDAPTTRAS